MPDESVAPTRAVFGIGVVADLTGTGVQICARTRRPVWSIRSAPTAAPGCTAVLTSPGCNGSRCCWMRAQPRRIAMLLTLEDDKTGPQAGRARARR